MQIRRWPLVLATIVLSVPAFAQTAPAPAPAAPPAAGAKRTAAPADARVYFISPTNGARIFGPVVVRFGLRNMGVARAGDTAPNSGHHHLLVDVKDFAQDQQLPTDRSHLHFGGGQTETTLTLPPGRHTLQLVLGDFEHRPHDPMVASDKIQITVLSRRPRPIRRWRGY